MFTTGTYFPYAEENNLSYQKHHKLLLMFHPDKRLTDEIKDSSVYVCEQIFSLYRIWFRKMSNEFWREISFIPFST